MIRLRNLVQFCFSPSDRAATCDWLLSVEQMQRALDRERMRSDRGASGFSLLEFKYDTPCKTRELTELAKILRQRIRATDDAGSLSPRRVGVVLPETSVAGAWTLAEDILHRLPEGSRKPTCEVYTYPEADEPREGHIHQKTDHQTSGDKRRKSEIAGVPATDVAVVKSVAVDDAVVLRTARPMEPLFAKPLPAWKRAVDILCAGTALIVFGPLMLVIAALIKITSPGPAIFKQGRDTLGGRPFTIYKFRTMCVDAESQKAALRKFSEQDGPAFKIARDPRITRVGHFLRKTSLDELPQLFNVLLGDMSIVGPRPLPCDESRNCQGWQRRRLDVTPGLTCIWQVSGRSTVSFADWARMDIRYIKSRNLARDVKLIVQTVPAVLLHRGAC
ncbi:MAG: sugar transferase [Planctomycetota bacterium]|nr:MAG: sugar transferase [Planctomycetota bacterium]